MFFKGSAVALAISSLSSFVFASDTNNQTCRYTPAWNTCQGENYTSFECATILVTKSYLLPASDNNTYELNLIRYPATVNPDTAHSIVVNFGGPGESGIQGLLGSGPSLSKQVNGTLHIVSFDPRGVGINDPYNCNSTADYPNSNDYRNQTVVDELYEAAAETAQQCNSQNPVEGKQIGTIAVAKDVRQIAYAVGVNDTLIRYWGFSYGTVLGDTIARLFPDEIGGMVLDGNINPNDYWFQFPVQEAANLDAGFKHLFQLCADAKSSCAWNDGGNSTYATLLEKFNDWVGATPGSRGTTSNLTAQDSYTVREMVSQGIKYGDDYKKCGNVLQYWYENPGKIEPVGDFSNFPDPLAPTNKKRQYDSNNNGNFEPDKSNAPNNFVLTAITGSDNQYRPGSLSGEVYTQWLQQYESESQYAGDISISNLWNYAPWIPQAEEYFNTAFQNIKTSPNPIIFVQTHYDPVTPSDSGLAAHAAFTNSKYVTTDGIGHCSTSNPSADLKEAIGLYWNSDIIPVNGTNYDLDQPNPFVDVPSGNGNIEDNENPTSPSEKRDLSSLFKPLVRRQSGEDTILSCQGSSNNTTTTSSTSSMSSTSSSTSTSATRFGNGTSTTTTSLYTTTTGATTTSVNGTLTYTTSSYTTTTGATTKFGNGTSTYTTSPYTITTGVTTTTANGTSTYTTSTYTTISGFSISTWATSKTTTSLSSTAKNTNSWASWNSGYASTSSSVWNSWDPKPSSTVNSGWNAWNSDSRPTTTPPSWKAGSSPVDPSSPTPWQSWAAGDLSKSTTTYVYSVVDICPTGLVTSTVTFTANCNKGCGGKPAIPDGYKTTAVYCSACATPSTVTVTVKVTDSASWGTWSAGQTSTGANYAQWSGVPVSSGDGNGNGANNAKPAAASAAGNANGDWNNWGNSDSKSVKPTTTAGVDGDWNVWSNNNPNSVKPTTTTTATSKGDWNNWGAADPKSVKPTSSATTGTGVNGDWNTWGAGSATGSAVIAKYTGAANANFVRGGLYVAVAAAVLVL